MFNNNSFYPYYNNLQQITGFRITPVARIEETSSIFPDLQGNPMFFFDQSRNEFYVKQRKVQTGEVETLRYALASEPLTTVKEQESINSYEEKLNALNAKIERLSELVSATPISEKVEKGGKDGK